ncbi:hypothetical protein Ssi02_72220 [Sinosporangium siamense]|uniref:DUF4429 domain-containing protein n=1 Tax=Sinosporangium siamense TaxID=1367973 RepID=A0A919VAY4_9ACTN|nr:hypothetical protein Ssi02_72220 [Sinosporangium siamense]
MVIHPNSMEPMAEITTRDGTWSFDGSTLRIVPGHDRRVHKVRQALGEVGVPLAASPASPTRPPAKAAGSASGCGPAPTR